MATTVVVRDPDILGGIPVFEGTRVPIQTFLDCLEEGYTIAAFIEDFPTVKHEQAIQLLEEVKEQLNIGIVPI
jgi:uncharacterized protein (DUF433 family)